MENCALYSHHLEFDKIVEIIKTNLPKAKIEITDNKLQKSIKVSLKSGFFSKAKTLTINYREREIPSYNLNNASCGLSQNLMGMTNFVHSIPMENQELKSQFIHKIMAVNAELAFIAQPKMNEQFRAILKRLAVALDAFIFSSPNSVFNASEHQHFIDKHFKLIVDSAGVCNIDHIDVNIDSKYFDSDQSNLTEEQLKRKEKSEAFIKSHGIKTNENLPCIQDSSLVKVRSKGEIIHRIYALLIIAARGEGVEKARLDKVIEDMNIISLSPKEKLIYNKEELSQQDKAYATWRYESLNVLLWATGKTEYSFPNEICDVPKIVELLMRSKKEEFVESCKVKSTNEILDELDKIYRINWACVDARIKGETPSEKINPSVIYERHYALNWLTNYNDQEWDEVSTDT
jgi:hypothetical protein